MAKKKTVQPRNKQLHDTLSRVSGSSGRHVDKKSDYCRAREKHKHHNENTPHDAGYFHCGVR